jgi:prenyltransferase beta subunit
VKHSVSILLILGLAGPILAQTADEKKETIAYLDSLGSPRGGYRLTAKATAPSLRATSSALRALKYFGGKPKDAETTLAFVHSCFDRESGGFADTPGGKPDVVLTAVGLMALVELKAPLGDFEKKACAYLDKNAKSFEEIRMAAAGYEVIGKFSEQGAKWVVLVRKDPNPDGTFGKGVSRARDTGGTVAAILRMGARVSNGPEIRKALDADQLTDGGFGRDGKSSDLETTYRVSRAYHMLKGKPARADDLRAFIGKCRNADGGYGVSPGQPSSTGATYFASIVLHWLGE